MRETKFNNISAGTGLVAWEELVFRQQLQPGRAHILLGLGVGASVGAHLVYFPNG
jgi:hypothetical protein